VDYGDDIETNEDNDEQYSNDIEDDEIEDQLEQYEQVDHEEIDGIIQDARQNINPNVHEENENAKEQQLDHPEELHERADTTVVSDAENEEFQATEPTRRSTRETRLIERLEPKMSGKSYMQQKKKVILESDVDVYWNIVII
jgi:hypothetical protein